VGHKLGQEKVETVGAAKEKRVSSESCSVNLTRNATIRRHGKLAKRQIANYAQANRQKDNLGCATQK
jgi:hypothetical protein